MTRVHVAIDSALVRDAVAAAITAQVGVGGVTSSAEGPAGVQAVGRERPDVVVLAEPYGEPPERWIGEYRAACPGSKIVLLLLSSRAVDLTWDTRADAVVDAGDGVDELAAAIRKVVGGARA